MTLCVPDLGSLPLFCSNSPQVPGFAGVELGGGGGGAGAGPQVGGVDLGGGGPGEAVFGWGVPGGSVGQGWGRDGALLTSRPLLSSEVHTQVHLQFPAVSRTWSFRV